MSTTTMDELGRVLLPRELREQLEWGSGQELEIQLDASQKSIELRPRELRCSLCRQPSDALTPVGVGYVCPACFTIIKYVTPIT